MGKRSIANRIEKAEDSQVAREGSGDVPPEIARVKEPIAEEHGRDAYIEVLASIVLMTLPPCPVGETRDERTPAGFPDPTPESDSTQFDSVEERDEAIADFAEAWHETDFDGGSQGRRSA